MIPRRGRPDQVRWFEADPTFVLHFINAYEDGNEIVLDGFFEEDPMPGHREGDSGWDSVFRFLDFSRMRPRPYRWRFNLETGATQEGFLDDSLLEFGSINSQFGGRRHRYTYASRTKPGWFLFDALVKFNVETGAQQELKLPEGVFASESPMAPRDGSVEEDDGYVLTLITDTVNDRSECWVLDARDYSSGPLAKIRLPARISSGTHACWASQAALELRLGARGPSSLRGELLQVAALHHVHEHQHSEDEVEGGLRHGRDFVSEEMQVGEVAAFADEQDRRQ